MEKIIRSKSALIRDLRNCSGEQLLNTFVTWMLPIMQHPNAAPSVVKEPELYYAVVNGDVGKLVELMPKNIQEDTYAVIDCLLGTNSSYIDVILEDFIQIFASRNISVELTE